MNGIPWTVGIGFRGRRQADKAETGQKLDRDGVKAAEGLSACFAQRYQTERLLRVRGSPELSGFLVENDVTTVLSKSMIVDSIL